jgi:DNA mismatch repair protein MutH
MLIIIMMSVGVRGGEKLQTRAKSNNSRKLSGGPGRRGRILPANPKRMKIPPAINPIL